MIREHHGKTVAQIRAARPQAAIIRCVARGVYVSFDEPFEAIGHPTRQRHA